MPRRLFLSGKSKKDNDYDVVVHVGAPKTGSSAIQKFCLENGKNLLKEGFYYPKHALDVNGISGGHAMVSAPLLKGNKEEAQQNFDKLLKEARGRNAILLLSSEGIYRLSDQFKELTEGLSVKVVGFFRDPLESILSNYNQSVKRHFSTAKLTDFCKRILHSGSGNLSGAHLIAWVDTFGNENCDFQTYTKERLHTSSVEKRFLSAVGVSSLKAEKFLLGGGNVNKSYTPSALELKRLLNHVLGEDARELNSEVDWFLQGYSDKSEERYPEITDLLDAHTVNALCDTFEPSNLALRDRFGWKDASFGDYARLRDALVSTAMSPMTIVTPGVPLQKLCDKKPEVAEQLKDLVALRLKSNKASFSMMKLADLFNISINEKSHASALLPQKRLKVFLEEGTEPADFLRELSLMMESAGNLVAAERLIERARELRPWGGGIKTIHSRIKKERRARRS
ncbi:hypothetical protein OM427_19610 [Halomonas sp. 18H]|uniref:hypothetical protein n=1 Tax=Halomonas almeriensis TaxID=308163 RepID=UPI00222F6DC2|nr:MULTISPECIES: hypothetical protein [Halomonas]MCW4151727.1 hypothetical protein [Halomonas sp. 18H]MDN3553972.1 hypothetical protein [Halomonas almeriensis]